MRIGSGEVLEEQRGGHKKDGSWSQFVGAIALAHFEAEHPVELSLSPGDLLLVLSPCAEHGWLRVQRGTELGFVPESSLARQELRPGFMSHSFEGNGARFLPVRRGERIGLVRGGPTPPDGWALAVRTSDGAAQGKPLGPALVPLEWVVPAPAVCALRDFDAESDAQLSMQEGDILWALGKIGRGWLQVQDMSGRIGLVPDEFVKMIPDGLDADALTMRSDDEPLPSRRAGPAAEVQNKAVRFSGKISVPNSSCQAPPPDSPGAVSVVSSEGWSTLPTPQRLSSSTVIYDEVAGFVASSVRRFSHNSRRKVGVIDVEPSAPSLAQAAKEDRSQARSRKQGSSIYSTFSKMMRMDRLSARVHTHTS